MAIIQVLKVSDMNKMFSSVYFIGMMHFRKAWDCADTPISTWTKCSDSRSTPSIPTPAYIFLGQFMVNLGNIDCWNWSTVLSKDLSDEFQSEFPLFNYNPRNTIGNYTYLPMKHPTNTRLYHLFNRLRPVILPWHF
jgi:hypothetical protein